MKTYNINTTLQNKFAELSGDYNPLHIDDLYARKSIFGKQVVHGLHQIFIALEDFVKTNKKNIFISKISVNFEIVAGINENFYIEKERISQNEIKYSLHNEKQDILSTITFSYIEEKVVIPVFDKTEHKKNPLKSDSFNKKDLTENLYYDDNKLNKMFPNIKEYISSVNIGVLLASTRIVGMNYPGLNSIYKSLSLTFDKTKVIEQNVIYDVSDKHININLLSIKLHSDFVYGTIKAFIRPESPKQKTLKELKGMIEQNSTKNQRALIVGGTRGIGLQCLRLIALGGAETLFTYYKNQKDAENIVKEFKEENKKTDFVQLDVTHLDETSINKIKKFAPTHIYYFATPKILNNNSSLDRKIFDEFITYYIFGLNSLLTLLSQKPTLFIPSTIFVEELPIYLSEYVIAKSSCETYLNLLKKKGYKIFNPRFPKVKTEQTMSLMTQKIAPPEIFLIKELRYVISFDS